MYYVHNIFSLAQRRKRVFSTRLCGQGIFSGVCGSSDVTLSLSLSLTDSIHPSLSVYLLYLYVHNILTILYVPVEFNRPPLCRTATLLLRRSTVSAPDSFSTELEPVLRRS